MGFQRIPVSLKFDVDSDIFNDLISPMRTNKELSPFIVQLLEIYHTDETVKGMIDNQLEESLSPTAKLEREIAELKLKNRQMQVGTEILDQQHKSMQDNISNRSYDTYGASNEPEDEKQEKSSEQVLMLETNQTSVKTDDPEVQERLNQLESTVKSHEESISSLNEKVLKMSELIKSFETQNKSSFQTTEKSAPKKEEVSPKSLMKKVAVKNEDNESTSSISEEVGISAQPTRVFSSNPTPTPTPEPIKPTPSPTPTPTPSFQSHEEEEVEVATFGAPSFEDEDEGAPSLIMVDDDDEDYEEAPVFSPPEEEKPKKLNSFNKLMKSMGK